MPNARLGSDKNKFDKSLVWPSTWGGLRSADSATASGMKLRLCQERTGWNLTSNIFLAISQSITKYNEIFLPKAIYNKGDQSALLSWGSLSGDHAYKTLGPCKIPAPGHAHLATGTLWSTHCIYDLRHKCTPSVATYLLKLLTQVCVCVCSFLLWFYTLATYKVIPGHIAIYSFKVVGVYMGVVFFPLLSFLWFYILVT